MFRRLARRPLELPSQRKNILNGAAVAVTAVAAAAGLVSAWDSLNPWTQGLFGWLAIEATFYAVQCWRFNFTSGNIVKDAAIDSDFQAVVEDRLLDLGTIFGFEDFLCGWFRGAPFEKIKRGNLLDFIAYGFYCKRVEDLTPEELQRSEDYVLRAETKFNINFEEGRSDDIQFMAHLWEPLRWIHKPLFVFLGAEMMWVATDALLYAQGFRVYKHQGLRYWMMQPLAERKAVAAAGNGSSAGSTSASSGCSSGSSAGSPSSSGSPQQCYSPGGAGSPGALDSPRASTDGGISAQSSVVAAANGLRRLIWGRRVDLEVWDSVSSLPVHHLSKAAPENSPIFFIHGVGFGLTPYLHFVAELTRAFPTRPIILLEARHVSVCLSWRSHSTDAMADAAAAILRKHGWKQAAFMGHSYGTFVLSRIVQMHKPIVQSMVLMDPVCMLTIYPQLLSNFVYKMPNLLRMTTMLGFVDSLRFVFSRDLMVAESFCRKFVWHRECLWPEDLPDPCLLVLAAEDDLVPSKLLRQLLIKINHPCEVMYHPTAGHGGFLLSTKWRRQMIANIKVTVATGAHMSAKTGCSS